MLYSKLSPAFYFSLFFFVCFARKLLSAWKAMKIDGNKRKYIVKHTKTILWHSFLLNKKNGIKCLWKTMKTFSYLNYFNMRFIYYLLIKFHLNLMFITSSINGNMFKYCIRLFDFYFSEFYYFVMEWFWKIQKNSIFFFCQCICIATE